MPLHQKHKLMCFVEPQGIKDLDASVKEATVTRKQDRG
jgi:hypothetical protein